MRLTIRLLAGLFLVTVPLAAVPAAARAQQLSPTDRAIAAAVDAHNAEALALLHRIVEINSGTMNFAGVHAVADALTPELQALGFSTRWVDGSSWGRAGHLVAEHPGTGPKLLLIGHLDTVFPITSSFQHWKQLDDSTAMGPGIIDMKGGDVILLYALQALKDAGRLNDMHVVIVFDGDEEHAGSPLAKARENLIAAAQGATVAMGFEDGSGNSHEAVISRRGDEDWTLTTTGVSGHSSQIFGTELGAGAGFEAARILNAFYTKLHNEQYLTFSPGLLLGGTSVTADSNGTSGSAAGEHNVVASHMVVEGDIRTLSPRQLADTKAAMRAIVAQHLPHTTATIAFDDGYPPMAPTDNNRKLLASYNRASEDLGLGPVRAVNPSLAGAADVAFIAQYVPFVIDAIGLSGHDDHSEKETAYLNWLPRQTKRAALTIDRVGH